MKAFERIFLYSVLAILVFYVFLQDSNVESQVAIQEEIRAKSILIVNDVGKEVVVLFADKDGNGVIEIFNKFGNIVAGIGVNVYDSGAMGFFNKTGINDVNIFASEQGGEIVINNKDGKAVIGMGSNEYGGVMSCYGNEEGTGSASLLVGANGGGMTVSNKDGNLVALMAVYNNDNGTISLFDKYGKLIASLP